MSLLLFPFKLAWNGTALIFNLTGRLLALILGLVFIALGVVLCATVVGAVIGIPLAFFGGAMVLRGLF